MNPVNPAGDPIEEPASQSTESDFGDILRQFEQQQAAPKKSAEAPGPIKGTVLAITEESIFIDIHGKADGVLPKASLPPDMPEIAVGDMVEVTIVGRTEEGQALLSPIRVEKPKDWSGLLAAFNEKRNVAGKVTETVKGGVRVDIGARAFMPASRSGTRDAFELQKIVGQEIEVRILSIDVEKEDVVVDRRVVLEEEAAKKKDERFLSLKEGDVVHGRVRSVTDFGAFLDLGGVDGLLHVADMSWHRVGKPADVVKIGDELDVKILKLNTNTRKVSLGLKQMSPDPWTVAAEKFTPGQRVTAPVTSIQAFGAFVDLGDGIDGMIHIGDMANDKRIDHPRDVVKEGQVVRAIVIDIDKERRRIRLGMKQLQPTKVDLFIAEHQVGETISGRIADVRGNQLKVEVAEGILADCKLEEPKKEESKAAGVPSGSADVGSLAALLKGRWKEGKGGDPAPKAATLKPGMIRTVKISGLDAEHKRITVDLAE